MLNSLSEKQRFCQLAHTMSYALELDQTAGSIASFSYRTTSQLLAQCLGLVVGSLTDDPLMGIFNVLPLSIYYSLRQDNRARKENQRTDLYGG